MSWPVALVTIAAAGYQYYQANKQQKAADRIGNQTLPEYSIPETEFEADRLLERQSRSGFGRRVYDDYEDFVRTTQASSLDSVRRLGGTVNDVGRVGRVTNDSFRSFAIEDGRQANSNRNRYALNKQRLSRFIDKEFELNKVNPAIIRQQQFTALNNQAAASRNAAFGTLVSGTTSAINAGRYDRLLEQSIQSQTNAAAPGPSTSNYNSSSFDRLGRTALNGGQTAARPAGDDYTNLLLALGQPQPGTSVPITDPVNRSQPGALGEVEAAQIEAAQKNDQFQQLMTLISLSLN